MASPFISWTSGNQPVQYTNEEQLSGLTKFGLSVGALGLFGTVQFGQKRGFDYYLQAVRGIEEYSPGRILRTFQLSHMLSPLESASRAYRYFSPEIIRNIGRTPAGTVWLENLERLTGQNLTAGSRLMREGFRFEGGRLLIGQAGEDVLLAHAGIIRSPLGVTPAFQEGYFRSLAGGQVKGLRSALTSPISYLTAAGEEASEVFSITGGASRLRSAGRFLGGYGTALVERFNQLVRAPGSILPGALGRAAEGLGKMISVAPSSGLKTLGGLALKLGVGLPAAYYGYNLLDWSVRQAPFLDNTFLSEGITGGLINLYTGAQVGISRLAEMTGGHALREWQEDIAPGSTSLSRLLAFPLMGAIGGATLGYGARVARMAGAQYSGMSLAESSLIGQAERSVFLETLYKKELPETLTSVMRPEMIDMVRAETGKVLEGWRGKIVRGIVGAQEKQGILGGMSRMLGKMTPSKLNTVIGAGIGLGLVLPFLPGALVPSERPGELEDIYSGRQLVPIRRGRQWEMGRSAWEGGAINRFVPNWNVRYFASLARDVDIYGGDYPAIAQFFMENFTYDVERRNYYRRPYPVTGEAFSGIPLIGPLLAATIGRVIKPQRMMHTEEEYMRQGPGGEEIRAMPLRFGERPSISALGETGPGMPISATGVKGTVSEQVYRLQEMVGLPGFTMGAIKQNVTGTEGLFEQEMRLQSAERMTSHARRFYEEELGGMAGLNEWYRRLFPRPRRIPEWNAIPNAFADIWWMPGAGERSPNFQIGDPYAAIEQGELRLPGPVYSLMHPELAGIDPNDWPAIARYRMLADIGPYTEEFDRVTAEIGALKNQNLLTPEEEEEVKVIKKQLQDRKNKRQFYDYKYREKRLTPIEEILAAVNEETKAPKEEPSWFSSILGSYWETLAHNAETPFEFLTPISPASKFVHMRTAVEDYERMQVYGRESAFWQSPIRDFFSPFLTSLAHAAGSDAIPENIDRKRHVEEYFDMLKWVKMTRLKRAAETEGDMAAAHDFEQRRRETLFGVNPFTMSFAHIFRSLPRRERDYFNEFVKADLDDQAKILSLVPENERAFYLARWQLRDVQNMKKAIQKGLLSDDQVAEAQRQIDEMYEAKDTEGFPKTQDLWMEYLSTRLQNETYPDWYRRTKLLEQMAEKYPIPGPDWVGFNPLTSLRDVKLKIVENLGDNPIEYDIWPEQQRIAADRPLAEVAAQQLMSAAPLDQNDLHGRIRDILAANNITAQEVSIAKVLSNGEVDIDAYIQSDRSDDIEEMVRKGRLLS